MPTPNPPKDHALDSMGLTPKDSVDMALGSVRVLQATLLALAAAIFAGVGQLGDLSNVWAQGFATAAVALAAASVACGVVLLFKDAQAHATAMVIILLERGALPPKFEPHQFTEEEGKAILQGMNDMGGGRTPVARGQVICWLLAAACYGTTLVIGLWT